MVKRLLHGLAGVLLGLISATELHSQEGALFRGTDEELVSLQGNLSQDVALGDIDGNGTIDAVVAQGGGGSPIANVIWLNSGTGAFTESAETLGLGDSQAIGLGDLDGDGDLDAWVGNAGDDEVWVNQGGSQGGTSGTFVVGAVVADGSTQDVALGDLDGDSDLDAFVIGAEARIWWNDGAGQFVAGPALPNTWPYCAALADLDQDGDLDVVVGGEGAFVPNQVWWNEWEESEQFTEGPTLVMDGIAGGVEAADLDGDALPDVFIATSGSNQVWWNNGDRTFTAGALLGNENDTDVALADFDGDRDVDAFVVRRAIGGAANGYWLNNGDRSFTLASGTLGNDNSYAVAMADLNADGQPDAFVANSGPNKVYLNIAHVGGRRGFFSDSGQLLESSMTGVALGDVDGDGDLDAVTSSDRRLPGRAEGARLWLNQGGVQGGRSGVFLDSGEQLEGHPSEGVALGDVDGDNDLDVFFANSGGNSVWLNQGGAQAGLLGEFADSGQALGRYYSQAVALADLDGDEDLDALVANSLARPRLWVNQGGSQGGAVGEFVERVLGEELEETPSSDDVVLGDLDGDGDVDAILNDGSDVLFFINQGGAQNGQAGEFSGQVSANDRVGFLRDFALGDLDDDFDLDLYLASYFKDTVWVNQGGTQGGTAGELMETGQELGANHGIGAALGDVDGDGDLDAFVVGPKSGDGSAPYFLEGHSEFWINDGTGRFTFRQAFGGGKAQGVALGDLDGDGDLDAFVAREAGGQVWLNGEVNRLPVVSYALDLEPDPSGELVYNWWGTGNAIIPLFLSQPADEEIVLRVSARYNRDGDYGWSRAEEIRFPPGSTVAAMTAFPAEEGGRQGEIWNIYQGAKRIESDRIRYLILVSDLSTGVVMTSPTDFWLDFRNPDFGNRQCVLDFIGELTEAGGRAARSVTLAGLSPRPSGAEPPLPLESYRALRDQVLAQSPQGQYFIDLYRQASPELLQTISDHNWMLWRTVGVIQTWGPAFQALADGRGAEAAVTDEMLAEAQDYLEALRSVASPELAELILAEEEALDLRSWQGGNLDDALSHVEQRRIPAAFTQLSISQAGGSLTLRWWGETGISYQVQRSPGSVDSFEPAGDWLEGTGAYQTVELPLPDLGSAYYRLEMQE